MTSSDKIELKATSNKLYFSGKGEIGNIEFEVGENEDISKEAFQNFSVNIIKILNKLKSLGYKTYHMPRFSNLPYSSIEVLCIRK